MYTHIQKWGNSLGLRIPIKISQQLKLKPGSAVQVKLEEDRLVILPQKYQLDEMLANITEENVHHLAFADHSVGNEEW